MALPSARLFVGFAAFLVCILCSPAASEAGRPLIRTFVRQEHKAHAQFHAPFQSPEGLMYFGNQLAVMEYDGRNWRVLKIPLPFTRAMAPGPSGEIYVGDEEQLGVLATPDSGEPRYTSLLDRLPAAAKPFGFVRDIHAWQGDIYFVTDRNLLRYRERDQAFRVWPFAGSVRHRLFHVSGRLLLHRQGHGLYEFTGEELRPLSTAPEIARARSSIIVPGSSPQTLVVGLDDQGLFSLSASGALTPFATAADAILRRTSVLTAARLRHGELAIGTVAEGVVILDAAGKLLCHATRESGLPHATVFALCEDREGALWLGTNNAPARLLWRSAATVFEHGTSGLTDARVNDFERHGDTLYLLSNDGLYRLVRSDAPHLPARFERDARIDVQTRLSSLLSHPHGLLLAGGRGLQRLTNAGVELLVAKPDGLSGLSRSTSDPSRIFFAHARGIGTGTFAADGTWRDEGDIPGLDADCHDVFEHPDGTLWVGTVSKGVYRATRPPGSTDWRQPAVTLFGSDAGLPSGHGMIFLWKTPVRLLFDTAKGIYRFDAAANRFAFHRELTAFDSRPLVLNPVAAGAAGELWTNGLATDIKTKEAPYPLLRLRANPDGTFTATTPPPEIQDFFSPGAPYRILWEPTNTTDHPGIVWAKGDHGLLRIDLARYHTTPLSAAPLVRTIAAEGRELVFPRTNPGQIQLRYSREPMTISWVSGRFGRADSERFQTRLVGFNDTWSAPSPRNDVAFTNLERGPFRFEVRAVDRQGSPGPVTAFSFQVTPPWPRSNAAFAVYSLVGCGAIFGFVRWRLRAAERERSRLEQLVADRTHELRLARDAADAASRAKSTFLANMSHELRTPLNGVIGYAQILTKDPHLSAQNRERLRVVQTSGEHLLRMINEVLDLSKIEAGRMELAPAPFHLPQLLRDIAAAQQPRAIQKDLSFHLETAADLPKRLIGDAQKLRQVLDNLLGNAIKFTTSGSVTLSVSRGPSPEFSAPDSSSCFETLSSRGAASRRDEALQLDRHGALRVPRDDKPGVKTPPSPGECLTFAVTDTGVGISDADRAKLFQPFHQATDGRPPEPGTGLGLAISQRIVSLMGGQLDVESRPGHGTRFHFTLALPLAPAEAAAPPTAQGPITGYHGRRRTLLLVDDVATNRHVLRDLLSPLGFAVHEASSGSEALAAVPALRPDLVFLDLRMPDLDGFEVARRLRARSDLPALKIIATSASVLSFNRDDAIAAGCDAFLPKPFREAELLARLRDALGFEWITAQVDAPPAAAPAPNGATPALPPETLRQFLDTARRGEISALRQQLIAHRGDALADELLSLAQSYQMERIRQRLEARLAAHR